MNHNDNSDDSDDTTTVRALRSAVAGFIEKRDWEQFHTPQELAVSISIEAAELLEIFQWKLREELPPGGIPPGIRERIREELADVMIYALGLANVLGEDVSELVMEKLQANERKYPVEKSRGNARKYTELERD